MKIAGDADGRVRCHLLILSVVEMPSEASRVPVKHARFFDKARGSVHARAPISTSAHSVTNNGSCETRNSCRTCSPCHREHGTEVDSSCRRERITSHALANQKTSKTTGSTNL
jgi:hypothetical protein